MDDYIKVNKIIFKDSERMKNTIFFIFNVTNFDIFECVLAYYVKLNFSVFSSFNMNFLLTGQSLFCFYYFLSC